MRRRWRQSLYRRMLAAMWTCSRPLTALFVAGVVATSACSVGVVLVTGTLVGRLPAAVRDGPGSDAAHRAEVLLVVVAAVLVAQQLVGVALTAVTPTLGRRLEGRSRYRVMAAALAPSGIVHLFDRPTVDAIASATTIGSATYGPMAATDAMAPVSTSMLTGLGMTAVVGTFRWWLGLLIAFVWLVARDSRRREEVASAGAFKATGATTRRRAYLRDMALTPGCAKEVRVFGLAGWLGDRYDRASDAAVRLVAQRSRGGRPLPVLLALLVAANAFALWFIADAAQSGEIGLRATAVLLQAVLGAAVIGAPGSITQDAVFAIGASSLSTVDDLEQALGDGRGAAVTDGAAAPAAAPSAVRFRDVSFHDVSFRYPGAERTTLDGVELQLEPGRSLAIVGENGAGKTTLVKLLCGLLPVTHGVDHRRRCTAHDPRSPGVAGPAGGGVPGLRPVPRQRPRQRGLPGTRRGRVVVRARRGGRAGRRHRARTGAAPRVGHPARTRAQRRRRPLGR